MFVKHDRSVGLVLVTDSGRFQTDSVTKHLLLKNQIDSIRTLFRETGIEEAWRKDGNHSLGNIAASVIEFVFDDATSIVYPVDGRMCAKRNPSEEMHKRYFTTISKSYSVQEKFKDYESTFEAAEIKNSVFCSVPGFKDIISLPYYDTEVQIVHYLFFEDQYYTKLRLALKQKGTEIFNSLKVSIQKCFKDNGIKREEETINILNMEILPVMRKSTLLLEKASSYIEPNIKKDPIQWMIIENCLKGIKSNDKILYSLAVPYLRYVLFDIYTELDPCPNCEKLIIALSERMNKNNCNPKAFLNQASDVLLPKARFIALISSSSKYSGSNLRNLKQSQVAINLNDKDSSCIFMPIDNLKCSISMLRSVQVFLSNFCNLTV
jgi:hypothetical protein